MDPTYDKEEIKRNGVWGIAFIISEMVNDNAPSKYIPLAEEVIEKGRALGQQSKETNTCLLFIRPQA